MLLDRRHRDIARIALAAAGRRYGVAFAGGGALQVHDVSSRQTQDVDLFVRSARNVGKAADVMVAKRAAEPQRMRPVRRDQRARGRLLPLAAAAGVVVIALGTAFIAHLVSPAGNSQGSQTGSQQTTQATPGGPRPEFYLTATYPPTGPNVLQFQVRRTDGGAVTGSRTISGANLGWGGYLTAAAGNRAFYIAEYPCTGTGVPFTTFDRITITSSGRISAMAPVGRDRKSVV